MNLRLQTYITFYFSEKFFNMPVNIFSLHILLTPIPNNEREHIVKCNSKLTSLSWRNSVRNKTFVVLYLFLLSLSEPFELRFPRTRTVL